MIYNDQKHRPNRAAVPRPPHRGAAEGGACVSDYFISQIFMNFPYIFHIYIYIYIPYIHIHIYIYIYLYKEYPYMFMI